MSNYFKDYLNRLHNSDEKTKHRSALTISVLLSAIILAITFVIFKDSILSLPNQDKQDVANQITEEKIESPISAFSSFFQTAGSQFGKVKNVFKDISNLKGTATNTNSN